jgi:hypothetical protein
MIGDSSDRAAAMADLAEQCDALCLDFDLSAALASSMTVGDAAILALAAAPSIEERALIRAGVIARPIFTPERVLQ